MTQEKREELETDFWSRMISNEDRRKELEKYSISNSSKFFQEAIYDTNFFKENTFLASFVDSNIITFASLKSFYINRNSGFNFECKYNGRTLFGTTFQVSSMTVAANVYDIIMRATSGAFLLASNHPLISIISGDSPNSEFLRATLRNLFELPSYSNIYGYLDMIAAFTSPELLNRALKACECLTMEEVKEIALAEENQTMDSV